MNCGRAKEREESTKVWAEQPFVLSHGLLLTVSQGGEDNIAV